MYSNKEDMNLKGSGASKKVGTWDGKDKTWNPLSLVWLVWLVIACGVQRAIIYAIGRGREMIEIVYYKNWRKQIGAFICVPILGSIHCDFMVAETDLAYSFIQRRLVQRDPGATPSNQSLPLLTKCQPFVPFSLLFSAWNLDDFAHIAFLEQQQTATDVTNCLCTSVLGKTNQK